MSVATLPGVFEALIDGIRRRRFDASQAWANLSADEQRAIGAAALLVGYAELTSVTIAETEAQAFEAAHVAGQELLIGAVGAALGSLPESPPRPDLSVFGVRACRRCGCIDAVACAEGCEWVAGDLCSACVQ